MRTSFICGLLLFAGAATQAQTVAITFEVDMSWEVAQGRFQPATETVDVAGSFNNWGTPNTRLADPDGDLVYVVTLPALTSGTTVQFKFRQNGAWDGSEEFPGGGPNRSLVVPATATTYRYWYSDRTPTSTPLVAAYGSSATRVRPGSAVRFTDASSGTPSAWQWTFEGGTPATSTERDPSVTYAEAGVYDLMLVVSGSGGRVDTLRVADAIHVDADAPLGATDPIARSWRQDRFYEIYVRSFADSDGDGVGDLRGLTSRLDYLTELGVNGIWLMPIHPSPSDHGYDVTDYRGVNPQYGTLEDFRRFLDAAHSRGIKVILDYVLNHTSSQHPWFVQAAAGNATYRNYYRWSATNPGQQGPWGQTVWHQRNSTWYYGLFWSGMPDVNYDHAPVKDSLFAAAQWWLEEVGVDGFRLDAVLYLDEDGATLQNTPRTFELLQEFKTATASAGPTSFLVGEAWTQSSIVKNYVSDGRLDYAFEFDLAGSLLQAVNTGQASTLANHLNFIHGLYGPGKWGSFLSNHDQDRVSNMLDGLSHPRRLHTAAKLLLTVPGVPYLYYAEEIGARGAKPDPNIRMPINWTTVENQRADTTSLWHTYRRYLDVRRRAPIYDHPGTYAAHANGALLSQHIRDDQRPTALFTFANLGADTLRINNAAQGTLTPLQAWFEGPVTVTDLSTGEHWTVITYADLIFLKLAPGQVRVLEVGRAGTSSVAPGERPGGVRLEPAYPNPFNPSSEIGFQISVIGKVRMEVFDVIGRKVAVLVDGLMPAGAHRVRFDATGLASGVYLVRLEAGTEVRSQTLTLLR